MVDLLPQNNRIVTSDAPRSSLSGQDIASPYVLLADNMARAADVANDVAVRQAEKAGIESVGPDGQITKPAIPLVGDAAVAFEKAARVTSLNKITPDIQNKMTEIRIAHQNDPNGFKTAADAFTKEYLDKNVNDPLLRGAVEKTALDAAGASYRHVLQSTDAQNVQNLLTTSQARLTDINDRSAALARQGLVDTPEYAELHQARSVLYNTLASDPRTGFTAERASQELKSNRDRDVVQQVIGQTVKGADNEADVRKALDEKFWGKGSEGLKLTPQQRDAAISEGVSAYRNQSAEDSEKTQAMRSTVNEYASNIQKAPGSFDDVNHNNLVTQATALGDRKSVAALSAIKTMAPLWRSIAAMPMQERGAALAAMQRGVVPTDRAATAMQFFQERGWSKEAAAGIVGNLIQESNLNPNTVHDNGTGLGIAGHRLERLDALKSYAASKGKPATDFQTQLEFIDRELQTNESATGQALKGARTAQDAATAFISYERPLGWTAANPAAGHGYSNRVANATALAGGASVSIRSNIEDADKAMNLTPQERALYERHFSNLTGPGGVDNPDGSRSTLFQTTVEHDGKFYAIPTVFDGKILWNRGAKDPAAAAIEKVQQIGWDKFPAYKSEAEAEARYQQMHAFMEKDTAAYQNARKNGVPPLIAGTPIGSQPLPVQRLFQSTIATLREQQGTEAQRLADDLTDRFSKGQRPYAGQVEDIVTAANAGARPDILDKVRPALVAYDVSQAASGANGLDAAAAVAQARTVAAGGAGMVERKVLDSAASYIEQSQKRLREDPLGESARAGWVAPPQPLVLNNPTAVAQEMQARDKKIGIVQQHNGSIGPVKAIGDEEARGVATALTQGDPQAAGGILDALQTLSPDNYMATMAQKDIAGAVTGMMSSRDPTRMTAAMSTADKLWRTNPTQAKDILGNAAITKLQAWQALKDSFRPDELVERLNMAEDPSSAKAREVLQAQAETEAKSLTPSDIAYKLGTGWPGIGRLTGSTPGAPTTYRNQNEVLAAEYRSAYTALRAYGVDQDKASDLAAKRLQSTWGASETAGNQVMKNPPERYYPSISESHDWMRDDLNQFVTQLRGPQSSGRRSLEGGIGTAGVERNWTVNSLLSDSQTQAEITAGRPPSYQVMIQKADGTLDLLPKRIAFDPSAYIAVHGQKLEARRQSIDWQRQNQFTAPAQP